MKNFDKSKYSLSENLYLSAIFLLFGVSIMSLAPRTPDLKANLNINNGTFGTLLSSASIGSIIMLLISGQIVHRIGAKAGLRLGSTIVALSFIILVHTRSPLVFLFVNIAAGAGISLYHIASTGHTLHRQDEVGQIILPKLYGAWGFGAMSTAALAFAISTYTTVAWHITILMIIVFSLTQFVITKLAPTFPPSTESDDTYQFTSLKQLKFKINWFISIGFFCASIMEFAIADWATLFGKEELGMGTSVATLCYLIYIFGLTVGRFSIGWALNFQSERFWIKTSGGIGGAGFIIMTLTSLAIVDTNRSLAYALAFFGFLLAGLGSSAMSAIFFSIVGRLSNGKNALAVAQLSFVNTTIIFFAKTVLAWIVQISSITVALCLTGLAMFTMLYFGKIGSKDRQ